MDQLPLAEELEALHPDCFGWALSCCDYDRDEAEDVLQDVYFRIIAGKATFDGRSALRTWIFGVIRNRATGVRRTARLRAMLGVRHISDDVTAEPPSPADDAIGTNRRQRTRDALMRLSPRQREVLQLVFYHDLTIEEAATVMHVSLGSARTHYERGKARLALLLLADHDDGI